MEFSSSEDESGPNSEQESGSLWRKIPRVLKPRKPSSNLGTESHDRSEVTEADSTGGPFNLISDDEPKESWDSDDQTLFTRRRSGSSTTANSPPGPQLRPLNMIGASRTGPSGEDSAYKPGRHRPMNDRSNVNSSNVHDRKQRNRSTTITSIESPTSPPSGVGRAQYMSASQINAFICEQDE